MKNFCLILLGAWVWLLSACTSGNAERPTVAVTIPPLQYWAEQLAGDRMEVVCAVPDGGNPESYDLPPSTMVALAECRLYFSCGHLGFERAWLDKLATNNPDMQIVDLSEGLPLIYGTHHHHDHEGDCMHHEESPDPHTWCSLRLVRRMLAVMCREFTTIDSEGRNLYIANHTRLDRELATTDSLLTEKLQPFAGRTFAIYHPTLSYWAADYNLRQLALEPDGKSPSPQHLRAMVDSARATGVEVVFIQREFDPRQAETFAREVGCRTEIINPLAYGWQEEIMRIADAFAR